MAKRQLTERELYLQQHLHEIQKDQDPFDKEIEDAYHLEDGYGRWYRRHTLGQLAPFALIKRPNKPKPKVKETASVLFVLAGAVVIALLLFHCIIWVLKFFFDITWNTWGWTVNAFCYGIGVGLAGTVIAFIYDLIAESDYKKSKRMYKVYEKIKSLWTDRCDILRFGINHELGLPCPSNAVNYAAYRNIKDFYLKCLKKQNLISNATDDKIYLSRQLMDEKLRFLYNVSLKAEVSPLVYKEFKKQISHGQSNISVLRSELPQTKSKGYTLVQDMPSYDEFLNRDGLAPIIEEFEAVCNRDTSFLLFFTDSEKKAQQTDDLRKLVIVAKESYDELLKVNKKLSYVLEFVRGCTYRNIYLGAELLNFVRNLHGGGSLEKQQDTINLAKISTRVLNTDISVAKTNLSDTAFSTLSSLSDIVHRDRNLTKFTMENPKVSLGIAAVVTIGNVIEAYQANRRAYAEVQEKLCDSIGKIADGYTEGRGQMLRVVEIIKAIIKANRGFMSIYEPLSKKVYDEGELCLSKEEQTNLSAVINKYKEISEAKIK